MSDDEYYIESKKIRIKYEILLLKDLLYLNYKYNSLLNNETNIFKVYNEMKNTIVFSEKDTKIILEKCLLKLKKEYNLTINEFGNLIIKK